MRRSLKAIRDFAKYGGGSAAGGAAAGAGAAYAGGGDAGDMYGAAAVGAVAGGSMAAASNFGNLTKKMAYGNKADSTGGRTQSVGDILGGGYAGRQDAFAKRSRMQRRQKSMASKYDSVGFSGGLKSAGIGAGAGFAYSTLPSNQKKGGVDYDKKFEYMRRVKRMQVDENTRMHAERYKYGKDYHKWKNEYLSDDGGWF